MTPTDLQHWLTTHIDQIVRFLDYEPTIDTDEELADTLDAWLGGADWRGSGHRFVHLGIDGMGGQFAAWVRPEDAGDEKNGESGEPPVVLFGSEGGRGVVARSPEAWAQIVAWAPFVDEYGGDPGFGAEDGEATPIPLEAESSWLLKDPMSPEEGEAAREALEEYRAALEERFGEMRPLEELAAGREALDAEFRTWVEKNVAY